MCIQCRIQHYCTVFIVWCIVESLSLYNIHLFTKAPHRELSGALLIFLAGFFFFSLQLKRMELFTFFAVVMRRIKALSFVGSLRTNYYCQLFNYTMELYETWRSMVRIAENSKCAEQFHNLELFYPCRAAFPHIFSLIQ